MANGATVTGILGKEKICVTLNVAVKSVCKMELSF
jgi:hypothetical protein